MFDYTNKKPLHKYSAQFGGTRGSIQVFSEGIVLTAGGKNIVVRGNYVQSLGKVSDEPFTKVKAQISFYDMFGNVETQEFVINDNDFRALKADLGK